MKIEYFIYVIVFICINSNKNNSIIRIPRDEGSYQNISTKNGLINYGFRIKYKEFIKWPVGIAIYVLEGIKNLNLLNLTELKKGNTEINKEIYGENKDSIKLEIYYYSEDIFNDLICKILYKTKYIDKMIYSYGILNKINYKYFGGFPENIIKEKELKKITFSKDDRVSKIIIRNPEDSFTEIYGNEIIDILDGEGRSIEIVDDLGYMVCIPNRHSKLLEIYEKGIYEEDLFKRRLYYKLDKSQQKYFGSISFIIGNKNVTLNRDDILLKSRGKEYTFLAIDSFCPQFKFGTKFLNLFEFSEFNMETNEVSLFVSQNNKIITEKIANNEIKTESLNSNINCNYYIVILLLSFIAFMISITLVKNYQKNKKIQYYNEYYNI